MNPQTLHREAMQLADEAMIARRDGRDSDARSLFHQAFERECTAANHFADKQDTEPTRSVLHRSAASLALDIGDHRAAEKLISTALAGDPPAQIAEELRDLMETVHFARHLELRGVRLEADEFQFSMEGSGVGFGIAPAGQFVSRVRDIETLVYRTAERTLKRPFRESGRRKKSLDESLQLFVSVPRAASFAVTFRVGAAEQLEFAETGLPSTVVREVLDCFDMVNQGDVHSLQQRIGDEAYFRNFIALTQKIAPDGEVVRSVGFTAGRTGNERRVALTVPRRSIAVPRKPQDSVAVEPQQASGVSVEITGTLLEADAKGVEHGRIEVRTAVGTIEVVVVPRGLMRDIVKPLFEEEVVVAGTRVGSEIHLENIRPAED